MAGRDYNTTAACGAAARGRLKNGNVITGLEHPENLQFGSDLSGVNRFMNEGGVNG